VAGTELPELGQLRVDAARSHLLEPVAVVVSAGEDGREAAARRRRLRV
jgi:hypothetical protein